MQNLIELADLKIREGVLKEEALDSLISAGILDANGNFTPNYVPMEKVGKLFFCGFDFALFH